MLERGYAEGTMYVGFIAGMVARSVLTSARLHGTGRARIMRPWVPAVIVPLAILAVTRNLWLMGLGVALAGLAPTLMSELWALGGLLALWLPPRLRWWIAPNHKGKRVSAIGSYRKASAEHSYASPAPPSIQTNLVPSPRL